MKKIFRLIAALAATTVAFSCMEEANPETPETGKTNYDGPVTTLEFTLDELETKTAWDGENHTWSDGDMIKIIWMDAEGKTGDVPAEVVEGKVTATVGVADTYYAVYPADAEYILETKEGETEPTFTARIQRNQDGSFEDANLMAAKTTKNDLAFAFKNLTHILKFNLAEGHGFKALEICPNTEVVITGRYFVDFTDNGVEMTYNSNGNTNSKYITVQNLEDKSGIIYVGLIPDADISTGIALRGRKAVDDDYRYFALSKAPIETKRSGITNIKGNLNEFLRINEYYIAKTAKGNGDGSSWSNAADISKFITLLNKIQLGTDGEGNAIYTKNVHQWRLEDANIHIAAGEYNIPEANGNATFTPNGMTQYVNFKVIGGYPAEPSEGSVQNLTENQTVFTTINKDNVRIIRFDNAKFENIVFDGITFKGLGETVVSSVGVGTYFSNNTAGTITYNNCKFTEFNNSNTGSNGAVFLANSSGELSLNFTDCEFSNNKTASKGIIALAQKNTTTTFTDCIFTSNTTTDQGGALYCTAGTLNLTNCSFISNGAGTIPETAEEALTTFDVNRGGSLYISGGTAKINYCTFDGNYANVGADIVATNAASKVYINRSVFKNGTAYVNSSQDWHAKSIDASFNKGTTLFINNSIFCNNTSKFVTDNTGLPCIKTNGDNVVVINTSFYDGSMRFVNQANATTSYVVNNVAKYEGSSKRGLAKAGTRKYNLTNAESADGDTNYGDYGNLTMSWTNETNMLTWALNETITIAKHATANEISTDISTKFEDFDIWLKTVEEKPYEIDFYGNERNPEKLNPGAWDPGL